MFKTFINAFKVKDVRRKIFYVLMMLVVIRLGSQMPVPGVNTSFLRIILQIIRMSIQFPECIHGRRFRPFLHLCSEYYTVHYFFHHYSAAHHCNSTT